MRRNRIIIELSLPSLLLFDRVLLFRTTVKKKKKKTRFFPNIVQNKNTDTIFFARIYLSYNSFGARSDFLDRNNRPNVFFLVLRTYKSLFLSTEREGP